MPTSNKFQTAIFLLLWLTNKIKNRVSIAFVLPRRKRFTANVAGKNDTCSRAPTSRLFVTNENAEFNDVNAFEESEFDGIEDLLYFEDDELDEENLNYDGQYEIYKNRLLSDDIMIDYEVVLQSELPDIPIEEEENSKSSSKEPTKQTNAKKKNKSSPITMDDLDSLTMTKESDIAYFYLKNELGLSEEYMWKITTENGSLLGMTATNLRNKVQLLRSLMDLSNEEVRYMVMRMPAVLHYSAKGNVAPTALFLQRSLDLSRKDLKRLLLDFPSILGYSMQNLKTKFNFYLKLCGFTKEEARKMFLQEPKLLTAGVRTGLVPRMHFLVKELEFPLDVFREIVKKNPLILLSSLEMNLRPKLIFYLILNVGLDVSQVQTLLRRFPQFTNYNLDNKILPMQRYFCEQVDFSISEYGKMLLKDPKIIIHSLINKVKHTVGYFRYELALDSHEVRRILYQAPQVLNLNTEGTLKSKVNYLQTTLNLTNDEVKKILTGMPTLLLCSVEKNIKLKLDYLHSLGLATKEVSEMTLLLPTMLGYSLEKRIKPRMEQLIQARVPMTTITIALPMKESYFESWLKGRKKRAAAGQVRKKHGSMKKAKRRIPAMRIVEDTKKVTEKETNTTANGRIQHWTRPRKQSSFLSPD